MKFHFDHHPESSDIRAAHLSRRSFLKMAGALAGSALLAGCRPAAPAPTATLAPTLAPTFTLKPSAASHRVAIAQAATYDYKLVRQQVQAVFDQLGGLGDVVKAGDRVAMKVNLVGGTQSAAPAVIAGAPEAYVTHPAVARAMGELLRDAGAKEVYIVECVWDPASYSDWGYVDIAKPLNAQLIDLNDTHPYTDYATVPVGPGAFIYEQFSFNHLLQEVDALVSVAKMKCHWLCGVSQSMKNLIGLAPLKLYEVKPEDGNRSAFHGPEAETKHRLPRVVLDLNRARPVTLSLIDGIKTVDGSEGPWNNDLKPQSPGLLIGGKNPVATDAVSVAAMGFDPTADYPAAPFLRGDNHLNLARELGLGSNRLTDIEILGAKLDEVKMKFLPALG